MSDPFHISLVSHFHLIHCYCKTIDYGHFNVNEVFPTIYTAVMEMEDEIIVTMITFQTCQILSHNITNSQAKEVYNAVVKAAEDTLLHSRPALFETMTLSSPVRARSTNECHIRNVQSFRITVWEMTDRVLLIFTEVCSVCPKFDFGLINQMTTNRNFFFLSLAHSLKTKNEICLHDLALSKFKGCNWQLCSLSVNILVTFLLIN